MGDAKQETTDEAPEVLAFRAEVARVRDSVIPAMREKQEAIDLRLGVRRARRRSSPMSSAMVQMSAGPPSTRRK